MRENVRDEERIKKWRGLIEDQARSSVSIAEFCKERRVARSSFWKWKKKLRERQLSVSSRFISISKKSLIHSAENISSSKIKNTRLLLSNGIQIDLGASLDSPEVQQWLLGICGGFHAKS